jgi:PRTRC genetic system protein C
MALTVEQAQREFKYNGTALQDPDPKMTAEAVREFYANLYPDINNAAIEGPEQVGAKLVYEFRRAVGTKGQS